MGVIVVQIELIIAFLIIFFLIVWAVWYRFSRWRLKKKYNPDNDKGKKAELSRFGGVRGEEPTTDEPTHPVAGPTEPTERHILEATSPNSVGGDKSSPPKPRRNPFRRKRN